MSSELDRKLKTALDESRLLILGAQVLFGFAFEGVFQDLFRSLGRDTQKVQCAALGLLLVSIGWLIVPSMYHQIACNGESRVAAVNVATRFAGASLLPLTLGLGATAFVVFDRMSGRTVAGVVSAAIILVSLALLYGLGFAIGTRKGEIPVETQTLLKTKIEQLLTEARVIIPGAQALLGFQLIATLTKSFSELPQTVQVIHAAGLCVVALSATLLMTPAALHRLGFHGEDNEQFFRIASYLVVAAALPLAAGISAEVMVVFYKVFGSMRAGGAAGIASLTFLLACWYAFPLLIRHSQRSRMR